MQEFLKKKDFFSDGLFTLAHGVGDGRDGTGQFFGRQKKYYDACYIMSDDHQPPALSRTIFNTCEMLPVYTKKWIEFMAPIFDTGNYSGQTDLVTAAIVMNLKLIYDKNRLVPCEGLVGGFNEKIPKIDGKNSTHVSDVFEDEEGTTILSRDASYWRWSQAEDFKITKEAAKNMFEYIQSERDGVKGTPFPIFDFSFSL